MKNYNGMFERIFLFAGMYNIGAAVTFVFGNRWLFQLINIEDLLFPSFMYLAFSFVFVFGIGYIIVSKDLTKNHDIIRLGILSKMLAFFIILHGCIMNILPPILYVAALIDLMWALIFIYFLKKNII